jgi:hypothetical protein
MLLDNPFTNAKRTDRSTGQGSAYGAVPQDPESWAILKWLINHREDAEDLRFLAWIPPLQVRDNPFTGEPATLVRVILQSDKNPKGEEVEHHLFYIKDGKLLGTVRADQGQPPPNGPALVVKPIPISS